MAASSSSSVLLSVICGVVTVFIVLGMRNDLASSDKSRILGGFLCALIFMFSLIVIDKIIYSSRWEIYKTRSERRVDGQKCSHPLELQN
jgi:hypothetical protein